MRHAFFLVLCGFVLLGVAGCAQHIKSINPVMTETPKITITNLTDALKCIKENFNSEDDSVGLVVLVDKIFDGTIRQESLSDGKLSDAGKYQLLNVLFEYLPIENAIILDKMPTLFSESGSTTGLNEYGLPDGEKLKNYVIFYKNVLNKRRKNSGLPQIDKLRFFYITGIFSAFDGDVFSSTGTGIEGGNDGTSYKGNIGIGIKSEARSVTLVFNVTDLQHNILIATKSYTITAYNTNSEYKFALSGSGNKEGSFGFADEEVIIEGLHGAQKTLIDAMAIWLISKIANDETISSCIKKNNVSFDSHKKK